MLRDSLIFELCDLMKAAIDAASQDPDNFGAFHITAEIDASPELVLEHTYEGVRVLLIPSSRNSTNQTLDGRKQRDLTVNVIVSAKCLAGDVAEVRQLDALSESISAVLAEDVPAEMEGLEWTGEQGDPVYDHEALRNRGWFHCELVMTWTLYGGA